MMPIVVLIYDFIFLRSLKKILRWMGIDYILIPNSCSDCPAVG